MRKLLFTDSHSSNRLPMRKVDPASGVSDRLRDSEKVFQRVFEIAEEQKVGEIIHLGDFFDRRLVDSVTSTRMAETIYGANRDLFLKILPGNHDWHDLRATFSSLGIYKHLKSKISVEEKPITCIGSNANYYVHLVPYLVPAEFRNWLQTKEFASHAKHILFMHQEVAGARHRGFVSEDGLEAKLFDRFVAVYSGHFHARQRVGKVFYIGAPQQDFGDEGNPNEALLLNITDDGIEETFFPLPGPRFKTYNLEVGNFAHGVLPLKPPAGGDWYIRFRLHGTRAELEAFDVNLIHGFLDRQGGGVRVRHLDIQKYPKIVEERRLSLDPESDSSVVIAKYLKSGVEDLGGLSVKTLQRIGMDAMSLLKEEEVK